MTLQTAGLIAGFFLLVIGVLGIIKADTTLNLARRLPRSRVAGFLFLTVDLFWSLWLLATMEMGEFSGFRKPLLIALPIGFFLVLRFVDEFLAVRAIGILFLLAAEPLLEAAFFRDEQSRLLVTTFAYLLIVLGLLWGTMPYLLRDQINWAGRTLARWRFTHGLALLYGGAILAYAVTQY